jgi:hypothetical protein
MWRIIVGIYDGDPRLTNDRKRSVKLAKARVGLVKLGNG